MGGQEENMCVLIYNVYMRVGKHRREDEAVS